ncbi:ANTAR domain-containing protein [Streptomyces sp. NPDC001941]|uniref:ANTAR domain-containing protein n=1 Tax=Streptomyces sp. NPDC001941 TaxID=3154659 RepID=UPI0033224F0E
MAFFALSKTQPLRLLSATDAALEQDRLRGLNGELERANAQLLRAVESHAVIDQAIGVVVTLARIPPAHAWDALREVSMRTNVKVRDVAGHVVAFAQGEELPEPVRGALGRVLDHRGRDAGACGAGSVG